ncbi:MAG TPA: plastocyanin/azurin family copper-binding protein [Actinomycetota bacterium]|nr:plastocyanin/azurin family copper-binding protein [Actinomycetota bacterium]
MRRGIGLAVVIVSACAAVLPIGTAAAARPEARGAASGAEVSIEAHDFYFDPAAPTIGRGDTVTFDFAGDVTHTATDSSGLELFDSGNVPPGSGPSLSFTYEAAGVYHFVCTPHAGMAGRVSAPMRATRRPVASTTSSRSCGRPRLQPATTSTTCRSSGRGRRGARGAAG